MTEIETINAALGRHPHPSLVRFDELPLSANTVETLRNKGFTEVGMLSEREDIKRVEDWLTPDEFKEFQRIGEIFQEISNTRRLS